MRIFSVFAFMAYCHLLKAFTITVSKDLYVVEYGSNVTMECRFPVEEQLDLVSLIVYWEMEDKKIIQFVKGKEDLKVQHRSYSQRAQLLKDQLFLGKAALQITNVTLEDAGVYCCLIGYGGADYKRITLKVHAPYRKINQRISVDPVTSEHELMCQAEGYPTAEVIWTNSTHQVLNGKTIISVSNMETKLFNVTSTLRINTTANEIFYCTFLQRSSPEGNSTAELVIPEPFLAPANERTHFMILGAILLFLVVVPAVTFCLKKQDVRTMDVEKCDTTDMNSKKQNDLQFEET
ncbi:programmed cell death 1 ligand 1 [Panthera pardus]|uniref:Programmed cell death 1 ligand 1 n=2 Tax=Panthera TaxID=9688 RepID=A0A8C8XWQ3_PANLE|nr:programmed cell death 1 ligand 1 [Panthera pardus]XP_042769438.1 programmed cell death 1 ligand 1 [Panthera leo]XP_049498247.1 programmed cell death 1 ligand 1 isoform X2 [Panthera uncia]XP_058551831.1 programmed cell death 1 ligand 1 [Neofelis nebulosa]